MRYLRFRNRRRSSASLAARSGAGFTLLEVLVAVGAIALISIGLARVFGATGATLRAGRRLSNINEYAALMERTLRNDFANLTRDGCLVIVNETIQNAKLSKDDANPRDRRSDQLVFFTAGKFTSLRTPLDESRIASSSEARIYYGHGLLQDRGNQPPATPVLDDLNDGSGGQAPAPYLGLIGPNQYAGDWMLLRHQTLIAEPKVIAPSIPASSSLNVNQWPDSPVQIDLQPAAASIFRNLTDIPTGSITTSIARTGDALVAPRFASGLVDIASGSLRQMRLVVLDAQQPLPLSGPFSADADLALDGNQQGYHFAAAPGLPSPSATAMIEWMKQLLPVAPFDTNDSDSTNDNPVGHRMRYEVSPPDYLGTISSGNGQPYSANESYRRTDQTMLTSSNFVPHVTSFIVEYSFGNTYAQFPRTERSGQLIWHGMVRFADVDADGQVNPAGDADVAVRPYQFLPAGAPAALSASDGVREVVVANGVSVSRTLPSAVIQSPPSTDTTLGNASFIGPLYTTFGYVDPTYSPPAADSPDTIAVPWPKLVRITYSLADPSDPLVEQTFQFVVELPASSSVN